MMLMLPVIILLQQICLIDASTLAANSDAESDLDYHNLNLNIYGHRGGIRGLVPEHSVASYTIGAQNGAMYLEPDVVVTKDGELIVLHDFDLLLTTDILDYEYKYANRSMNLTFWKRGNPQNYSHGQPADSVVNRQLFFENGYFSFNFTLDELKELRTKSQAHKNGMHSPMDGYFSILTFNETLALIRNLSLVLDIKIGVIPETKHFPWLKHAFASSGAFNHLEEKVLQSLFAYEFIDFDPVSNTYRPKYWSLGLARADTVSANNQSSVILQSFAVEDLVIFNTLTNNSIPTLFLLDSGTDSINTSVAKWIVDELSIDGIGGGKAIVDDIIQTRNALSMSSSDSDSDDAYFTTAVYTLVSDVDEYMAAVDVGLDAVFSDDVCTARVVHELLIDLSLNFNDSFLSHLDWLQCSMVNEADKCGDDDDDDDVDKNSHSNTKSMGKIEIHYALIGAGVALLCGAFIGILGYVCWNNYKYRRLNEQSVLL